MSFESWSFHEWGPLSSVTDCCKATEHHHHHNDNSLAEVMDSVRIKLERRQFIP